MVDSSYSIGSPKKNFSFGVYNLEFDPCIAGGEESS